MPGEPLTVTYVVKTSLTNQQEIKNRIKALRRFKNIEKFTRFYEVHQDDEVGRGANQRIDLRKDPQPARRLEHYYYFGTKPQIPIQQRDVPYLNTVDLRFFPLKDLLCDTGEEPPLHSKCRKTIKDLQNRIVKLEREKKAILEKNRQLNQQLVEYTQHTNTNSNGDEEFKNIESEEDCENIEGSNEDSEDQRFEDADGEDKFEDNIRKTSKVSRKHIEKMPKENKKKRKATAVASLEKSFG